MEANRRLLDELMGTNRNGDEKPRDVTDFRDSRVCKCYLLGCCTHELLSGLKYDNGPCTKIHDPLLKKAYEEDPNKDSYHYDRLLLAELRTEINNCNKRIERGVDRFRNDNKDCLIKVEEFDDVKQLGDEIVELQDQVDEMRKIGKISAAEELQRTINDKTTIKVSLQALHLKEEQEKLGPEVNALNATPAQKTRVCNICGGMLSIFDVDQRLSDHFTGKSHQAYLLMRRKLKQLEETVAKERMYDSERSERRRDDERYERRRDDSDRYERYERRRDDGERYERSSRRRDSERSEHSRRRRDDSERSEQYSQSNQQSDRYERSSRRDESQRSRHSRSRSRSGHYHSRH